MIYDILIIGSGPAGLSAGLSAGRRDLRVLLLEKDSVGGKLANRHQIKGFPGVPDVSGPEVRSTIVGQLEQYDVSISLTAVDEIHDESPFRLTTTDGDYRSRAVIIAGGGQPTQLSVPDAVEYRGKGIFYCAMCDGPLYSDRIVGVSGSNDWALKDALFLTDYASKIILVEEGPRLAAAGPICERVTSNPDIEVKTQTRIKEVSGDEVLEQITLVNEEEQTEYIEPVDGLYVQHGIDPNTVYLTDLVSTTDCGAIIVDQSLKTTTDGIFAAGDIRQSSPQTTAAAIGDGVTACQSAIKYLETSVTP